MVVTVVDVAGETVVVVAPLVVDVVGTVVVGAVVVGDGWVVLVVATIVTGTVVVLDVGVVVVVTVPGLASAKTRPPPSPVSPVTRQAAVVEQVAPSMVPACGGRT